MYLEFYGLKEKPFSVTADPNFLYLSKKHREAISHMQYGIQERMGFLEITGEIGAGKTTVCKALLNKLDEHTKTAFILNGNLSEIQLLQAIIEDFGIQVKTKNKITILNELNKFSLAQNCMAEIKSCKLYLLRVINIQLFKEPVIQGPVVLKFESAD